MKNYSLDCNYYNKSFNNIDDLISDIMKTGMDPNIEILCNSIPTGETPNDIITF